MPSLEELRRFFASDFPQCTATVEEIGDGRAMLRQAVGTAHLRPGGTVSGPTMMALADAASYAAVLTTIGIVPLALTTSMHVVFLRRPDADRALVGEARLLKLGRRIAVVDVRVRSDGHDDPVAQATVSYAIPPR